MSPVPMYDGLLEYYDEIFPLESERIAFVEALGGNGPEGGGKSPRILLDVGCATGVFGIAMARRGFDVTGIDVDSAMIQSACRRNGEPRSNARFFCMDMRSVAKNFPAGRFDIVTCFGNTLAHLEDGAAIGDFIGQIETLACPTGVFAFQLVNYDSVRERDLNALPTIETPRATFRREYRPMTDGRISFETTLISSSGQVVMKDSVPLYPVGQEELRSLLSAAGFSAVEFFASFDGSPLAGDSLGLVGVARH